MATEMKLTAGELLSIFRNRKGLTQAQLGEMVFADLQTPNVKIKKIEKDQQIPTKDDIRKIAAVLDIDPEFINKSKLVLEPGEGKGEFVLSHKVKTVCPNIATYLKSINMMAEVNDFQVMMIVLHKMCREILSRKYGDPGNDDDNSRLPVVVISDSNFDAVNNANS